jgi:hypothetical protein
MMADDAENGANIASEIDRDIANHVVVILINKKKRRTRAGVLVRVV